MAGKKDYRTNRADYAIAAKPKTKINVDESATKENSSRLDEQRLAKLAENPLKSLPRPNNKPRG